MYDDVDSWYCVIMSIVSHFEIAFKKIYPFFLI